MERTIAVEAGLTPVRKFLQAKGYHVVNLEEGHAADAAVITGGDANMMGMQTIVQDGPVIDARGMRPEDVLRAIEGKWRH
ncbi:MAG: YkuS family protein [Firmicutes bacterium]|nr:YkuS family protein [Bacillota bacterium]